LTWCHNNERKSSARAILPQPELLQHYAKVPAIRDGKKIPEIGFWVFMGLIISFLPKVFCLKGSHHPSPIPVRKVVWTKVSKNNKLK
jgi:hypothetical protein